MQTLNNIQEVFTSPDTRNEDIIPFGNSPLPMQYLGAKNRISPWILNQIKRFSPRAPYFLDLFSGTGSVGVEALRHGFKVSANDMQPYAKPVLNSLFTAPRHNLLDIVEEVKKLKTDFNLLSDGRSVFRKLLEQEDAFVKMSKNTSWDWRSYEAFCNTTPIIDGTPEEATRLANEKGWNLFAAYYSNTYFGVRQSLSIDTLRQFAENQAEPYKTHILAAVISVMTFAVSSTTHLAQYLKPSSHRMATHLIKRRSNDIFDGVIDRLIRISNFPLQKSGGSVLSEDYLVALTKIHPDQNWVIYADPPYFKEHYSRYYHVLDTFYLYDFPTLTVNDRIGKTTIGRYRDNRLVSDFGKRAKVRSAFSKLFDFCADTGAHLALSYAVNRPGFHGGCLV